MSAMTVGDLKRLLTEFPDEWEVYIDAKVEGVSQIRNLVRQDACACPNVLLSAHADEYGRDWKGRTGWDEFDDGGAP